MPILLTGASALSLVCKLLAALDWPALCSHDNGFAIALHDTMIQQHALAQA